MKVRLCKLFLSIILIFTIVCTFSVCVFAEEVIIANTPIQINVETVLVEDRKITLNGSVSEEKEMMVSILVVPETVDGYTFDSFESLKQYSDLTQLYQNVVFAYNDKTDAVGNFVFKFIVPNSGDYTAFVDAAGVSGTNPAFFTVRGLVDRLNEYSNDFSLFKSNISDEINTLEADNIDIFGKLSPEQQDMVYNGIFSDLPFENDEELKESVNSNIQVVLDGILSEVKSSSSVPEKIVGIIKSNLKIFGVTQMEVYLNVLDDAGRTMVKQSLKDAAAAFTNLEDCKNCFDTAVTNAALAMERALVSEFNTAVTTEKFAEVLSKYRVVVGLSEKQCKMLELISNDKLLELCSSMIEMADENNDEKTDFTSYEAVKACFDAVVDEARMDNLVLDIINNKNNSEKIIEIIREYSDILTTFDLVGYDALKDGENTGYQEKVKKNFMSGDKDASVSVAAERFNNLVAEQKKAKELVASINNAEFSELKEIIENNYKLLDIKQDTYDDYLDLEKAEATDVINMVIKYAPYEGAEEFVSKFDEIVEGAKTDGGSGKGSGGGSSSGGGSNRNVTVKSNMAAVNNAEAVEKFSDLNSVMWAKTQILSLADKGIINGKGDNIFDPNGYVTREEFIKMLVSLYGIYDANSEADFTDVTSGAWYSGYIASAYNLGLVNGYSDGSFGVGKYITREDMAVFIFRAQQKLEDVQAQEEEFSFADDADISEYAKESVYSLKSLNIVNGTGDNMFSPKKLCTRAEAAVMLYNVIS